MRYAGIRTEEDIEHGLEKIGSIQQVLKEEEEELQLNPQLLSVSIQETRKKPLTFSTRLRNNLSTQRTAHISKDNQSSKNPFH